MSRNLKKKIMQLLFGVDGIKLDGGCRWDENGWFHVFESDEVENYKRRADYL